MDGRETPGDSKVDDLEECRATDSIIKVLSKRAEDGREKSSNGSICESDGRRSTPPTSASACKDMAASSSALLDECDGRLNQFTTVVGGVPQATDGSTGGFTRTHARELRSIGAVGVRQADLGGEGALDAAADAGFDGARDAAVEVGGEGARETAADVGTEVVHDVGTEVAQEVLADVLTE